MRCDLFWADRSQSLGLGVSHVTCKYIAKMANHGAHPSSPYLSELHNVRLLFRLLIKEHPRAARPPPSASSGPSGASRTFNPLPRFKDVSPFLRPHRTRPETQPAQRTPVVCLSHRSAIILQYM